MIVLCGKTIEGLGNLNITLRELNMHRKLWKTHEVEIFREVLRCELYFKIICILEQFYVSVPGTVVIPISHISTRRTDSVAGN